MRTRRRCSARSSNWRPIINAAYYNLGGTYIYLGRYDEAIDALNRSIELRPTVSAYSNLGDGVFLLSPLFRSCRDVRKALGRLTIRTT